MKRALLSLVCIMSVGCSDDPARSVKIVDRKPAPTTVSSIPPSVPQQNVLADPCLPAVQGSSVTCGGAPARPARIAARHSAPVASAAAPSPVRQAAVSQAPAPQGLLSEFCPPPAEDSSGPSSFVAEGPCEFLHRAPVACESLQDDFIVGVTRKAKNGSSLVIYINVEKYHGPGAYDGAQLFVAVQSGTAIHRWSSDNVNATVGPGEAFVSFRRTELEREPLLIECSRLIGPESNYQYQCAGTSDSATAIDNAPEVISGELQCAVRPNN